MLELSRLISERYINDDFHVPSQVYKQFQFELRAYARNQFVDLLHEHTDLFVQAVLAYVDTLRSGAGDSGAINNVVASGSEYISESSTTCSSFAVTSTAKVPVVKRSSLIALGNYTTPCSSATTTTGVPSSSSTNSNSSSNSSSSTSATNQILMLAAPPRGAKEGQLSWIETQLTQDARYHIMNYLPSERQTLLASYFGMLLPLVVTTLFPVQSGAHVMENKGKGWGDCIWYSRDIFYSGFVAAVFTF